MMQKQYPSCDTFVVVPPAGQGGHVVFGKNSDRPDGEVQEVVFFRSHDNQSGTKLKCTYIEVPEVAHTHAVILSKPAWMWGAEMGANEHGVCIGNEAVWSRLNGPDDLIERLLGMDLVRLGLERAVTARGAVDVMTTLLATHGQGGPCSNEPSMSDWAYHNSFLVADPTEAWVLETAGSLWAAERVTEGVRNISNEYSIGTKIDLCSPGLKEDLQTRGWYSGVGDLHFGAAVVEGGKSALQKSSRYTCGKKLLQTPCSCDRHRKFGESQMMSVLRDEDSGICMTGGGFVSIGSQVSVLSPASSQKPSCHWLTGTPDPSHSVFKPFVFTPSTTDIGGATTSPNPADPTSSGRTDRRHELYAAHQLFLQTVRKCPADGDKIWTNLKGLESKCLSDMREMLERFDGNNYSDFANVFPTIVNQELSLYK